MENMADAEAAALSREIGRRMFEIDAAAKTLAITLDSIAPGTATMSMPVRDDMTNMMGYGHGGYTFALADTTGGYAGNSRNRRTVAQMVQITFLNAARSGDVLTATANEVWLGKTYSLYDISVVNQDSQRIAELRAQCHNLDGRVIEELPLIS